ncbi:MAG: asparagine synthase [Balneolaceae bacterium]|nr:MAG: asparagine synthase [Balneolaceae bacterium]
MNMNVQILPAGRHSLPARQPDIVSGTVWHDDRFVTGSELTSLFARASTVADASRLCFGLTGRFRWIRIQMDTVWMAADHLQSMPLFYAVDGNNVRISTTPGAVAASMDDPQPDPLLAAEYLVLGYITGNETLMRHIRQVEPGTLVEISGGRNDQPVRTTVHRYMNYAHTYRDATREQFTRELDDVVTQTMEKAVRYADGRPVILPLSGGYDSRLIALSLARLNYPEVHCISYGTKGSAEMNLSRQVAGELGFRWTGVHYTKEKWRKWFHGAQRRAYYRKASREARIPNIQELAAFGELKENRLVPDHGVVMGGHLGDALVGGKGIYDSYTYRERPETNPETIIRHILHYHYYLWDWSPYRAALEPWFRKRILDDLGDIDRYPDSPSACEMWNIRERQARFIVTAGQLYDFFGYDFWMPFCDQDYLRFWLTVPLRYRHDKSLYTNYIDRLSPNRIATYQPGKSVLALREAIRNTPLFSPARSLYQKWDRHRKKQREYHRHPMAWYGIMEPDDFNALFTGRENINSFQSLELLRTLLENGYLSPDCILRSATGSLSGIEPADRS